MIPNAVLLTAACLFWGPPGPQNDTVQLAPTFSVTDLKNERVDNTRFRGRTTVLFVFCECRECRLVAEEWSRRARSAVVQTFACYSGKTDEVKKMANAWPGGNDSTRFLVDPKFTIAEKYRALPCPAAFVIDGSGRLRYSSKETAGELESDPKIIVDQILDSVSDIKSGRPVTLAPRAAGAKKTLVPVETSANIRRDDHTISNVISAPRSDKEATVERQFQFRNPSRAPVRIDQVVSSCGCSDAGLLIGESMASSGTVLPGKSVRVRVRLKVAPNYTGQRSVQVWLLAKGTSVPLGCIQIEVHGAS
ncbi:redoxin domain-containing protein [Fimbriimonas ginsengisoli]|uniref:Alkyl hydroperoxide reductase subunit C/ Thiol specific antioxidant domain-containing protein n=1 Tax=Fimbriimonas ginsengisoli Gsoil 348 TaxID=661478 RepID=A0A068NV45_FIMGI|nr:redoxin domain-containing protein [Fimbriimonas ginsengisoli]AIE86620.1 hypothetical protein OP10G_3252 [Fimbriimonas ginsengisoli Gsoil 348]